MEEPLKILPAALRKVPSLKYAFAIAAVAEVVTLIAGFQHDLRIAVFGTVLMIILMSVFVVFSNLATAKTLVPSLMLPALVLAWFSVLLLIATSSLLMSSYFFNWPNPLSQYSALAYVSDRPIVLERPITPTNPVVTGTPKPIPAPVNVRTATLDNRPISQDQCTSSTPCVGLIRGSTLTVTLTRPGYAAAFIQDGKRFYNQEGRTFIDNEIENETQLWPGTETSLRPTYKLWIVTSETQLPASSDSTALSQLPNGINGQVYGPIALRTDIVSVGPDNPNHEPVVNATPLPPVHDLVRDVQFTNNGLIVLNQQPDRLLFHGSSGWAEGANRNPFDITRLPILRIDYHAASDCIIYLELKNGRLETLASNVTNNNMPKYQLQLPSSRSHQVFNLSRNLQRVTGNTIVTSAAFSDPTEEVTITSLKFTAE